MFNVERTILPLTNMYIQIYHIAQLVNFWQLWLRNLIFKLMNKDLKDLRIFSFIIYLFNPGLFFYGNKRIGKFNQCSLRFEKFRKNVLQGLKERNG